MQVLGMEVMVVARVGFSKNPIVLHDCIETQNKESKDQLLTFKIATDKIMNRLKRLAQV